MRILSPSKEIDERLVGVPAGRGIRFEKVRESGGRFASGYGRAHLTLRGSVDETSFRCVGKIAFNYLAWRAGADFARGASFDAIRFFVRYGTPTSYPLVRAGGEPILADDTRQSRQTDGHLVTAAWTKVNQHIVGQVSLFNAISYSVSLARSFSGVWMPLRTGHHFDHRSKQITLLVATERS